MTFHSITNVVKQQLELTEMDMNIKCKIPNIMKGEYLISVRSVIDEISKLEEDLMCTVL